MKSRLGKKDTIFARTKAPVAPKTMETPTVGSSVENKLTVILPPGQVDFLDRLSLEIRSKTKAKVRRTEIIRALIAGLMGSGMDLTGFGTEEDIAAAIVERLKG
jgi:hypothetical protein